MRFVLLLFLCCTLSIIIVKAQPEVQLDLSARTTIESIPFDEFFFIKGNIPNLRSISITYTDIIKGTKTPFKFSSTPQANGDFKILFRKLLPPNKSSYQFTVDYSKEVPEATITRIKIDFINNIKNYIQANKDQIRGQGGGFINGGVVAHFQSELIKLIPKSSTENIGYANGSFLNTDPNLRENQALLMNLFQEIRQRGLEINDIQNVVENNVSNNIKTKLSELFRNTSFKDLRSFRDNDLALQVSAIFSNPLEAVECISTGGNYASSGLPIDCGLDNIEGNGTEILGRKALNYTNSSELFNKIRLALEEKNSGFTSASNPVIVRETHAALKVTGEIIRLLSTLPRQFLNIQRSITDQQKIFEQIAGDLVVKSLQSVNIAGKENVDFLTRSASRFSVDVGGLYAFKIDEIMPYTGLNIYFRPVHNRTSFATLKREYGNIFWHRFAILAGFSLARVNTSPRYSSDVFLSRAVILGAGFRINEFIRLNGGTLAIKQQDLNPLVANPKTKLTGFFSVSVDLQVFNLLKDNF